MRRLIDWKSFGVPLTAGVDEAGRGCLAGPVYAAAVILHPTSRIRGCTDSKLLCPEVRTSLATKIKSEALSWAIGTASVEEIELINILQASLLAMRRAVMALNFAPLLLLIDGNQKIEGLWTQMTITGGDLRCLPISAASILAKTERDRFMVELHEKYPSYELAKHKGYATPEHRRAIAEHGPAIIHRKTFAGVKEFLK